MLLQRWFPWTGWSGWREGDEEEECKKNHCWSSRCPIVQPPMSVAEESLVANQVTVWQSISQFCLNIEIFTVSQDKQIFMIYHVFLGRKSKWRSSSMLSARGRGRGRPSTAGKCQNYFFLQSPQTIFPSIRDKLLTSQTTRRRKKRHQSPLWQREAQRSPATQRKMKIPSSARRKPRMLNLRWPSWRTSRRSPQ